MVEKDATWSEKFEKITKMMEQEITSLRDESSKKFVKLNKELRDTKKEMNKETISLKTENKELKEEDIRLKEKITSLEKIVMIGGWKVCA